jgi:hypothetical protein
MRNPDDVVVQHPNSCVKQNAIERPDSQGCGEIEMIK